MHWKQLQFLFILWILWVWLHMNLCILNLQMLFHHQHFFFQINKMHLNFLTESAWFRSLINFLCVEKYCHYFASEWEVLLVSNLVFLSVWKQHLGMLSKGRRCFLGRCLVSEALEVSLGPLFLFSLVYYFVFLLTLTIQ